MIRFRVPRIEPWFGLHPSPGGCAQHNDKQPKVKIKPHTAQHEECGRLKQLKPLHHSDQEVLPQGPKF